MTVSLSYKNTINECPRLRTLLAFPVAGMLTMLGTATAFGISIDTVTIGGPGNAGDFSVNMQYDGGTTGYGSVPYTYEIGKTEVTSGQYAEFLNAVAKTADPYGLYNEGMDKNNDSLGCGITRSDSEGVYTYTATETLKPVNFVSIYDAMRFTNWLTNGAIDGADTETGVYTLSGGSAPPSNLTVERNLEENGATLTGTGSLAGVSGTVWALPSENEWYKAAYYSVANSSYSLYANGSSIITGAEANYYDYKGGPYEPEDVGGYDPEQNGTNDMMGSLWEWNDSLIMNWDGSDINARGLRGGAFNYADARLASSGRNSSSGDVENSHIGFRVVALSSLAAIPEAATSSLTAGFLMMMLVFWKRRGRRPARQSGYPR
ncbi:MAG: SUMF1/EgtB/PvdO family nonheme iron enzyme [Opitutaceae bacterium]|jgi:formylglycine-generating enzyme required for sulfatase activity|nr:SUMF1/EgtB/PvdO family nonheme iron enzyme [Opitutaceae bacterium]